VMEDLGFAVVLLLVALWISSWAILGAIVAGVRRVSASTGTLLGIALGPLGVMAVFALTRDGDSLAERPPTPTERRAAAKDIEPIASRRSDDVDPFA